MHLPEGTRISLARTTEGRNAAFSRRLYESLFVAEQTPAVPDNASMAGS